jgi:hypothetical protein
MADFKNDFYETEKSRLEENLFSINNSINNTDKSNVTIISGLLYQKMIAEKKIKLLERVKYYPEYMYKSCLLNADLPTYRSFIKDTYLNEMASIKREMQKDKKLLEQYKLELDNAPSEERQKEILILIGSIMTRDQTLQDRFNQLSSLSVSLTSKSSDDFSLEIINDAYNHNVNDIVSNYSLTSVSPTEKAIYQMMQDKNTNDKLQSLLNMVKTVNKEKESLMLSIDLSSLSYHLLDILKDKFHFGGSKINVNHEDLQQLKAYFEDLHLYLCTEGFNVLKNYDSDTILKINSSEKKSFADYYSYFNSFKMILDKDTLGYFNELYNQYHHLSSKPIKSLGDRKELKDLTDELITEVDVIIKELNERILSLYDNLIDKLHMERYYYPTSMRTITNKYDDISNRYKLLIGEVTNLLSIINKGLGILENKIDNCNTKIESVAEAIREETDINIDPDELSKYSAMDLFSIFKKVFLANELNILDNQVMSRVTENVADDKKIKKLPY